MSDFEFDLDARLRADAAAEQHRDAPPPFAAALDVATASRSRLPLLAVAASVVVIAGAAAGVAVLRSGDSGEAPLPAGASVSGVPPTRGNEVLHRFDDAGFGGVLLVPADPRLLDVVVPYSKAPGACSLFGATVTVVAQSATAVTLRASGYEYGPRLEPGETHYGFSCSEDGYRSVRVGLDDPLGSRTIRDSLDDQGAVVTPVDPADFPVPTHLPRGYRTGRARPADAKTGRLSGERDYSRGDDSLTLSFGATRDIDDGLTSIGHAEVDGHRATIGTTPGQRCLTWSTSAGISRQVCSYARAPLPAAELLAVARGLR